MQYTNKERAFLRMITVSELGMELIRIDPHHGYGVIVGSTPENPILFEDFSTHPNKLVHLDKLGVSSTAAGAYQILHRYFQGYQHQLALPDFTPDSQDRIAYQMLSEVGAVHLINNDDITGAIHLARSRWASFPGAGFGQHENELQHLLDVYASALSDLEDDSESQATSAA